MANQDGWVDVDEGWVDVPSPAQPRPKAAPKPTASAPLNPADHPMVNPRTGKYNDGFLPVDDASLPPMDAQPVPKDFGSRPGDPTSFAQNATMSPPIVDRDKAKGAWDRFTHAWKGNVQYGFPGLAARKIFDWTDYGMKELQKQHPDATPEQLEELHDGVVAESQKALRDQYEAESARDPAWRPDEGWFDNILGGRWAAAIPGIVLGQAGPESLIAPGGSSLARIGGAAAVNAAADAGYQGLDVADGVSDQYDPMQTIISAAAGAGLQGVFEGVAKLGKGWKAIRNPDGTVDVTNPNGEGVAFDTEGKPAGIIGRVTDTSPARASVYDDGWGIREGREGPVDADGRFLEPHEIAKQQLEQHLATPRTAEEQALFDNAVRIEAERYGFTSEQLEKALKERDFQGDLRYVLAEAGHDQLIVDRPPYNPEKVSTPPTNPAEPTPLIAQNDNPNQAGFDSRYAEQPASPLAVKSDGAPVAANENPVTGDLQIGTPETFGRVDGSGKTDTQDVTVYTDEEARKIIQERTGKTPPPPRSMAMGGEKGESIQGPTDGTPLALSKEPLSGGSGEPPKPPKSVVDRLTEDLKTAGKAREEQNLLYKKERAKRFAQVDKAQQPGMGQDALVRSKQALQGELPKADFEAVGHKYTQKDVDELFEGIIATPTLTSLQKVTAQVGLTKLMQGKVPTPKELQYLSESFPKEFIKAALSKRDVFSRSFGKFGELWNLPKSLMSSVDLSAPLRQGKGLIHRGEFWKSFAKMFKYTVSQKKFDALDTDIKTHPNYALAEEAGLGLTVGGNKLGPNEDAFQSHLAEKWPVLGPIVRGSERAYVGFLNKLRFDTFNSLVADAERLGHDLNDPAVAKGIARYINVMTGRGGLGDAEKAAGILNGMFFSPRLISSRLQMLAGPAQAVAGKGYIADLPKGLRKEAAKSYASTLGYYSTLVGLASLAGYDVEEDPRSSDFGKIRDGNTRIDLGGGLIQYITAGARALTRQSTSVKSGETRDLGKRGDTPLDSDLKFIFNKMHPSLTLFIDQQRGTDAVGNPFDAPAFESVPVPWSKAILSRLSPMGIPDIVEVIKEHPDKGVLYGILGILGEGIQNFDAGGDSTSTSTPPSIETVTTSGAPDKDGWVDVK